FAAATANCAVTMPVDSVAYGGATADYGTTAVALPSPGDNRALRLSNLNPAPANNSTEYSLNAVSTSTFMVAPGNLASDFTTPRNTARTVPQLGPEPPPPPPNTTPATPPVTATPTATNTPVPTPTPCGPDADGDGMPGCYETLHGCLDENVADGGA